MELKRTVCVDGQANARQNTPLRQASSPRATGWKRPECACTSAKKSRLDFFHKVGNILCVKPFVPLPEPAWKDFRSLSKNRVGMETIRPSHARDHTATTNPDPSLTLEPKGNLPEWNERPTEGCPKGGVGGRQQPNSDSEIWSLPSAARCRYVRNRSEIKVDAPAQLANIANRENSNHFKLFQIKKISSFFGAWNYL